MEESDFKLLLENNKVYILGDVTGYLGDKGTKDLFRRHLGDKKEILNILKITDKEKGVLTFSFRFTKETLDKFSGMDKNTMGKLLSNDISRDICQELITIALKLIEERNEIPEFSSLNIQQKEKLAHMTTVSTVNYMANKDVFELTYYF